MTEQNHFYFQYDETGKPLFYFEFARDTYYTIYESSFFSYNTDFFFERSIDYARDSVLEDYPLNIKFFYELLELDAQRYLFYENPIYHDFISKRYLIRTKVNFNLLKAEMRTLKMLQRQEEFKDLDYVSSIVSTCLNTLGKDKFEKSLGALIPLHK